MAARETDVNRFEEVFQALPLEAVVIDAGGEIVYGNRKFRQRFSEKPAAGTPILEALPFFSNRAQINWEQVIFGHVLKEGRGADVRGHPVEDRFFDIRVAPLKEGERITGGVITLEEVTERMEMERELVRQSRAASLAHLGASVAHEIRNPLNSIALNMQLLREGLAKRGAGPESDELKTVGTVLSEIRRLDGIIKNFLQYARPPQIILRLVDPNEAILGTLRLLEGEIRSSGVDVALDLDPLAPILMDRDRMSEAIYNIVLNAIQAMKDSPRKVLRISSALEEGEVKIGIRDTGPGISEEALPHLFDLFFSTREGGSGLGLPHAQNIVKAHRGKISVQTKEGEGTRFAISLPAHIILEKE